MQQGGQQAQLTRREEPQALRWTYAGATAFLIALDTKPEWTNSSCQIHAVDTGRPATSRARQSRRGPPRTTRSAPQSVGANPAYLATVR